MSELHHPSPSLPLHPDSCGDLNIRIMRDGTWLYHDSPIHRTAMVQLFARVLHREPDGSYWLVTPVERGRIRVDDTPFVAVAMTTTGAGPDQIVTFRTNLDETVVADADHPITVATDPTTAEPNPRILVRPGLHARIARAIFYDLVALAVECPAEDGGSVLGVFSRGIFFPLGSLTA